MSMTQRYAGMLRRHAAEWERQGMPVQAEATRQAARHMEDRERELIAEVARAVAAERERCAVLCEDADPGDWSLWSVAAQTCARRIRDESAQAHGQTPGSALD